MVVAFPGEDGMVPGLYQLVGAVFSLREHRETVYECRRCGTTLQAGVERCPQCDSDAIAEFEIE